MDIQKDPNIKEIISMQGAPDISPDFTNKLMDKIRDLPVPARKEKALLSPMAWVFIASFFLIAILLVLSFGESSHSLNLHFLKLSSYEIFFTDLLRSFESKSKSLQDISVSPYYFYGIALLWFFLIGERVLYRYFHRKGNKKNVLA